jgi:hypothetical protein
LRYREWPHHREHPPRAVHYFFHSLIGRAANDALARVVTLLSDGVATSVRCPCFLVGDDVLNGVFISPYLRRAHLTQTIVIVAGKLLPMPSRAER